MTIRTTRETVVFAAPFQLPEFDQPLPAGSYELETDEEMLEGIAHTAFHRTTMTLRTESGSAIENHPIDPAHLTAALERDQKAAQRSANPPAPLAEQVTPSVSPLARPRWVPLWVRNAPPWGRR
jgi:hypothetical protein